MRRDALVGNGVVLLLALLLVAALVRNGCRPGISSSSVHESVVELVKSDPRNEAWLEHVTDWDTRRHLSVHTDYRPDIRSSWMVAYEICTAIKQTYANGAAELPRLRIYGTDPDGDARRVLLASASTAHDFVCGITPSAQARRKAASLGVPVYQP